MSARPTLSWLELERYALGELPADERAAVEAALANDAEARACLAMIEDDDGALPALAIPAIDAEPAPAWTLRRWLAWAVPAVACAALVLFLLLPRGAGDPLGGGVRVKGAGGGVLVELVRERDGRVTFAAERFAPGDRFKLVVTCAPGVTVRGEVTVRQDGQVYRPLPAVALSCRNRAPVPGAFTLDGDAPAEVCLVHQGAPACVRVAPATRGSSAGTR